MPIGIDMPKINPKIDGPFSLSGVDCVFVYTFTTIFEFWKLKPLNYFDRAFWTLLATLDKTPVLPADNTYTKTDDPLVKFLSIKSFFANAS